MKKSVLIMTLIVASLVICVAGVSALPTSTAWPVPNPDAYCANVPNGVPGCFEARFEAGTTNIEDVGTHTHYYTDGAGNSFGVEVTVTGSTEASGGPGYSITWKSSGPVYAVIAKDGANDAIIWYYAGGATSDNVPLGPIPKGGAISHIAFCFGPGNWGPYPPPPQVPEFPTIALPMGMLVGMVGLVYFVRNREN